MPSWLTIALVLVLFGLLCLNVCVTESTTELDFTDHHPGWPDDFAPKLYLQSVIVVGVDVVLTFLISYLIPYCLLVGIYMCASLFFPSASRISASAWLYMLGSTAAIAIGRYIWTELGSALWEIFPFLLYEGGSTSCDTTLFYVDVLVPLVVSSMVAMGHSSFHENICQHFDLWRVIEDNLAALVLRTTALCAAISTTHMSAPILRHLMILVYPGFGIYIWHYAKWSPFVIPLVITLTIYGIITATNEGKAHFMYPPIYYSRFKAYTTAGLCESISQVGIGQFFGFLCIDWLITSALPMLALCIICKLLEFVVHGFSFSWFSCALTLACHSVSVIIYQLINSFGTTFCMRNAPHLLYANGAFLLDNSIFAVRLEILTMLSSVFLVNAFARKFRMLTNDPNDFNSEFFAAIGKVPVSILESNGENTVPMLEKVDRLMRKIFVGFYQGIRSLLAHFDNINGFDEAVLFICVFFTLDLIPIFLSISCNAYLSGIIMISLLGLVAYLLNHPESPYSLAALPANGILYQTPLMALILGWIYTYFFSCGIISWTLQMRIYAGIQKDPRLEPKMVPHIIPPEEKRPTLRLGVSVDARQFFLPIDHLGIVMNEQATESASTMPSSDSEGPSGVARLEPLRPVTPPSFSPSLKESRPYHSLDTEPVSKEPSIATGHVNSTHETAITRDNPSPIMSAPSATASSTHLPSKMPYDASSTGISYNQSRHLMTDPPALTSYNPDAHHTQRRFTTKQPTDTMNSSSSHDRYNTTQSTLATADVSWPPLETSLLLTSILYLL